MEQNILHDQSYAKRILDLSSDTLFLIDSRNYCVDVVLKTDNPIFNPNVQLIGRDLLALLPKETADAVRHEIDLCRATGESTNANYDLPTAEQMYYFKLMIHRFDSEHLLLQYRDITQRSNMKRRLKSALTALLEVGKVAKIGHWRFHVEQKMFVYSGYSNLRGYNLPGEDHISLDEVLALLHPHDRQTMQDFLFDDTNNYGSIDYRLMVQDTQMQYVRSTKYTRRIENDTTIIDGFAQNVSDFIKNRNELEMVLAVVFNAPYSIHASHLDGRLVFANKECRLQNKIAHTTILSGLFIYEVFSNFDSKAEWEELVRKIQSTMGFLRYRCDHKYPEMDIIGSECSSFIIKNGEGEDIVWTIRRDISDQLRYEEQLLRSKEAAEESERLKSSFISNMNHEIRTPLSAIIGFSNIIAETADPALRKEYGEILSSNSSQLLRLVTDVLEMSHIDAGKIRFLPEPTSLNAIFHELELSFGNSEDMPELIFETPQSDLVVDFDRVRIVQLLTNLVNNALKFTPPNGSIHIGYQYTVQDVELYVQDSGIGIPKDKQELIFDRFFKVNDAARGTGLGLAICKSIVDQMEGRIWVESVEGKGATFRIQLPLNKKS